MYDMNRMEEFDVDEGIWLAYATDLFKIHGWISIVINVCEILHINLVGQSLVDHVS
jgi:hypothetical protein